MFSIPEVAYDQVWYKQPFFYNSSFSISNGLANPFRKVFLEEEIRTKMTSVQGYSRLR